MCGIAGIIDWSGNVVTQHQLKPMTDAMQHRGPDAEGFFLQDNIGLGHRRLAIIDLSEAANQPMHIDDYVLVYNGEIYNYLELKLALQQLGYTFTTQSDAEVLLRAYQHWGTACLHHFNGMWAFAIYHKTNQTLFCSRDRFGVKPFYYTIQNHQFIFASEIKGILAYTGACKANKKLLVDYLVTNSIEHPTETFFDQIFKLPAAHYGIFDLNSNEFQLQQYYHIGFDESVNQLPEQAAVHLFDHTITDAIRLRLRSDVKVGTCLSGGLDSSLIASYASTQHQTTATTPFAAVTALAVDSAVDESKYAEQVVQQADLDWITTKPTSADFLASLDDVIHTQEEPFNSASVCMQYFVMQAAHEAGVVVLLDGQGADEVMLGYAHYQLAVLKQLPWHKRLKAMLQLKAHSGESWSTIIKNYLYVSFPAMRLRQQLRRWPQLKQSVVEQFTNSTTIAKTSTSIRQLQYQEITQSSLPALLRYEDKNSMRFSIETRLPFLDWRLVEAMISVKDAWKNRNGWSKSILRQTIDHKLPDSIVWRKKKLGFVSPDRLWLSDWSVFETEVMNSPLLQSLFTSAIPFHSVDDAGKWRLVCIAKWEKQFSVQLP
jgi:asparagine synthase (glutamine-hydrolysing)